MFTPLFAFLLSGSNRASSLKSCTGVYEFQNQGTANFGIEYSVFTILLFTLKLLFKYNRYVYCVMSQFP